MGFSEHSVSMHTWIFTASEQTPLVNIAKMDVTGALIQAER